MKNRWIRTIFTFDKKYAPWVIGVLFAGLLAWYWDAKTPMPSSDPRQASNADAADTYIPEGFVLVPIEVTNYESLDSILGKFGVVDLFVSGSGGNAPLVRVAVHIKILRAPLNPSHFAVLAPEDEAADLLRHSGPFTVVVQNPHKSGTTFEKPKRQTLAAVGRGHRKSRIQVELPNEEPNER